MIAGHHLEIVVQQCAADVHPRTMQAVVRTESNGNPYAIGVVGGHLARQPRNRDEAIATAQSLEAAGWNYSVGLGQVNRAHFARYRLDSSSAFDPCTNLRAASSILSECHARAVSLGYAGQAALRAAFSCYYSGNFRRGFKADAYGGSYVQRVVANAASSAVPAAAPIPVVPDRRQNVPKAATEAQAGLSANATGVDQETRQQWDAFGAFRGAVRQKKVK